MHWRGYTLPGVYDGFEGLKMRGLLVIEEGGRDGVRCMDTLSVGWRSWFLAKMRGLWGGFMFVVMRDRAWGREGMEVVGEL